jgi:hypothetical protein
MIVPQIRYFTSADTPDLRTFVPEDPDRFSIAVDMMIGPSGAEGEEQFEIQIATPRWLEEQYRSAGLVVGRHLLIVFDDDWSRIEAHLQRLVSACQGDDWTQVAEKISRFALWEFEDYVE